MNTTWMSWIIPPPEKRTISQFTSRITNEMVLNVDKASRFYFKQKKNSILQSVNGLCLHIDESSQHSHIVMQRFFGT